MRVEKTKSKLSKDVAISWPLVAFCTGRLEALPWLQVTGTTARGKNAKVGERMRREGGKEEEREMGEMEGKEE